MFDYLLLESSSGPSGPSTINGPPKTCVSASDPYATAADYIERVDVRLTGDLARDDGTQATPAELLTDGNLAAALTDASGAMEAMVLVSGRYFPQDLQNLCGNSLSLLKRIICGMTVQFFRERRGYMEESEYPLYKEAKLWLQMLHKGQAIFAFAETIAAGLPEIYQLQTSNFFYDTPTLWTNRTRYWGIRADRTGLPSYGAF